MIRTLAVCLVAAAPAHAQMALDLPGRLALTGRYVDERAWIVTCVDLKRIDPDLLAARTAKLGKLDAADAEEAVRWLRAWRKPMVKAGVRQLFTVLSLNDSRWHESGFYL